VAAIHRVLIWLHRYLGVAVGLIMLLWCLSGFVMMYHGYPRLEEGDRRAALETLRFEDCCKASEALPDDAKVSGFRIESLVGRPVLRVRTGKAPMLFDLKTGERLSGVTASQALGVAELYGRQRGLAGQPHLMGLIPFDQWTVEGASRRGPIYRFRFNDPAVTDLYIAGRTGEAAQVANRLDRFLGWIGAVPHWLYPTILRQNGELWSQVVIWTSLVGGFLTLFGLYIGVVRFQPSWSGRWSPYRGWFYWHHYTGLFFGVLTLTWVVSGLFTLNPWGFLDSPFAFEQQMQVQGMVSGAEVKRFVAALAAAKPGGLVQLEGAPLHGAVYAVARGSAGQGTRLDVAARPTPLGVAELQQALAGPVPANLTLQTHEDAYYYSGYERRAALPVWRADLAGGRGEVVYLDPETGKVLEALDATERANRWLRVGLHDLDFPILRIRPLWDIVVILLLAGVTGVCAIGAGLALLRVRRDLSGIWKR
jgi:uncharacterized iron-regulated membrane protein